MTRRLLAAAAVAGALTFAPAASATTLVQGTLRDDHGLPAAGRVQVLAWPSSSGRSALPTVGLVQVGADGRFAVPLSDPAALAGAADGTGNVDLMAIAQTAGDGGGRVFSAQFNLAANGQIAVASSRRSTAVPTISITADRPLGPIARQSIPVPCLHTTQTDLANPVEVYAPIGEINNAYADTTATFSYGKTADSSISTAYQADGGKDETAWKIDGSVYRDNTLSDDITMSLKGPVSRRVNTQFKFHVYRISGCLWENGLHVKPTKNAWAGGVVPGVKEHNTLNVCRGGQDFSGFTGFSRASGHATTFSNSFSVFGVSLGIRSGFSEHAGIHYEFGGGLNTMHRLCGSNGKDINEAPRIFSGRAQ
jgi:hypothetical protein